MDKPDGRGATVTRLAVRLARSVLVLQTVFPHAPDTYVVSPKLAELVENETYVMRKRAGFNPYVEQASRAAMRRRTLASQIRP